MEFLRLHCPTLSRISMASNIPMNFTGEMATYYRACRLQKKADKIFRTYQLWALNVSWPRDPEVMADIDEAMQLLQEMRKDALYQEVKKT